MRRIYILLLLVFTITGLTAKDFTVVIDAGHGGKDPGALSANKSIREKDITLKVALMVGESIKRKHPEVNVLYTRQKDVFVGLNDRARMANKANADLFQQQKFFIFFFNSNEHEPIHVHVMHNGCQSIFELIMMDGTLIEVRIREKAGEEPLSSKDKKTAEAFIRKYSKNIIQKWVKFFVLKQAVKSTNIKTKI